MPELKPLLTGLVFGESPRWHDNRLWCVDMGAHEVIALDLEGNSEVIARVPTGLSAIDWLPDGRMLIAPFSGRHLLRQEPDGSLVTHADLTSLSEYPWNDMVVDGRDNAYIGNLDGTSQTANSVPASWHSSVLTAAPDKWPMTCTSPMAWWSPPTTPRSSLPSSAVAA